MAKGELQRHIPDLSEHAVPEDEETVLSPEDLEIVEDGEGVVRAAMETRVSADHKERNDDKILGVPDRNVSKLTTEKAEWDRANIAALAEKESKATAALAERAVYGVFDGVSSGGAGVLASRIASGSIAERMAQLPLNADAEASRKAIEEAILAAHADVLRYRAERPDLAKMSATADILRAIDNKDGTFDVAYGHVGDSRIYVFDPASGELRRQTEDQSLAAIFHHGGELKQEGAAHKVEAGQVTKEELEQLMAGGSLDAIKNESARGALKMMRNPLMNAVGFPNPEIAVATGVFEVQAGQKVFVMTDGVHGTLGDAEIAAVLRAGGGQKELMEAASKNRAEKKSHDDISIVELGFERADGAAQAPEGANAALLRDVATARAETTALESLLARADAGDVEALTRVKDNHNGRDNVVEKILVMKNRALGKEKESLQGKRGSASRERVAAIAAEQIALRTEILRHADRHQDELKASLAETYAEVDNATKSGTRDTASDVQKKKSLWDRLTGK